MGYVRIILTAVLMLVLCSEEVQAQFSGDVCKQANITVLIVKLQTGFKEVFVLHRDGNKINGTVWAWQSNGITAGHGIVTGYFGGTAPVGQGLVLEVVWQTRSDITSYFQGPLHEGQGEGRASDLNRPFSPVVANATTLAGCAKWPEHDAAFCRDYASKAVAAIKENVGLQCGNSGPRWSGDSGQHLSWCLSLGATEELPNSETVARANALKACREQIAQRKGDIVQKPNIPIGDLTKPFCQDYASKAVAAAKVSVQLSCEGNEGPRWSDNFNDHLDWCMALNGDQGPPNAEAAARASALQSCREQIARRGEIVQKPNIPIGDLTQPVTPPPSEPLPPEGTGNFLKQMKP